MLMIALFGSLVTFAINGWIVPASNQAYRFTAVQREVRRGAPELNFVQLHSLMSANDDAIYALAPLSDRWDVATNYYARFAVSCSPIAFALFGVWAATLSRVTRTQPSGGRLLGALAEGRCRLQQDVRDLALAFYRVDQCVVIAALERVHAVPVDFIEARFEVGHLSLSQSRFLRVLGDNQTFFLRPALRRFCVSRFGHDLSGDTSKGVPQPGFGPRTTPREGTHVHKSARREFANGSSERVMFGFPERV